MLEKINSPEDLKKLNIEEKEQLAKEIREYILNVVSENGGHLASNLGVVELTIALHSVFNVPTDKIVWDVGHQTYVHKILTGRREQLKTIRKLDGLAGFPKTNESDCDCFNTGHSSTSISAALGMARARDLEGKNNSVIAVIGDGALTGGMALEALNDAGYSNTKMTVILNDNEMSISKNVGGLNMFLSKLRTKKLYAKSSLSAKKVILKIPVVGKPFVKIVQRVKRSIKQLIIPKMFFEDIGFTYLGPVDGHNIEQLQNIMRLSKQVEAPVLIHVLTKKGKGYKIAEENPDKFHATSPFYIETGKPKKEKKPDYSKVFGEKIVEMAKKDSRIVAITASMKDGTGLTKFQKEFPNRFFDIGIAEQHALGMAAGMAKEGMIPIVPIYSSFYQRAYDQVNHDMARMNVGVVIGIDRCGLVGDDGETHQGVFDIAMLRSVPNLILSQPKDAKEAQNMIYTAFESKKPFCIRYPRGNALYAKNKSYSLIPIGSWEKFVVGTPTQIVITYGPDVDHVINKARENKMGLLVVNARFFKPIDEVMMKDLLKMDLSITVYETDVKIGGLSSAILEFINTLDEKIHIIGIEDHYVCHGSIRSLRIQEGISTECLFEELEKHG